MRFYTRLTALRQGRGADPAVTGVGVPQRSWDLYSDDSIVLAQHKLPPDGMPGIAWHQQGFYTPDGKVDTNAQRCSHSRLSRSSSHLASSPRPKPTDHTCTHESYSRILYGVSLLTILPGSPAHLRLDPGSLPKN